MCEREREGKKREKDKEKEREERGRENELPSREQVPICWDCFSSQAVV